MTNTDLPNIFQIYISDDGSGPSEALSDAIASVKRCFSAYQYSLHNNDSLRTFIEENFDNEVVESYDKLRPFAYKADLGRYCLLYQLGGWYSYRMSKAALNMGFKTLEIEWMRKHPHIKLLLIHPGTTDTQLSKPFQQRLKLGMLQTVEQTSEYLIKQIIKKLNGQLDSLFIDFNGIPIEW